MRFKIDRASLKVGIRCAVFAMFYFVFDGNFPSTSPPPPPPYILRGDLGLIFGEPYTWRHFFS